MSVTLLVPAALRGFTGGQAEFRYEGDTVGRILSALAEEYPDIKPHLFDEKGTLRHFVNVFVGEDNIKGLGGLEAPVMDGLTVMLVPAIAGGSHAR
jgi:molybdopterin converting factor small subunit